MVIAGGGGDNAASAVGIGAVRPGEGFVSLGTSGVIFLTSDRFRPNPASAMHAFCHALPGRWHQMSVMLSAASSLQWVTDLLGAPNAGVVAEKAGALSAAQCAASPLFLPYLGGERTPHNDANVRGPGGLVFPTGVAVDREGKPATPIHATATTCENCHLGSLANVAGLVPANATKTAPGTGFATPAPSSATPRRLKNSHSSGISTPCATVSALMASRPSDGWQSIRM